MNESCLICGGTGTDANGKPCPECSKNLIIDIPVVGNVPTQYQGVAFDKSFLPLKEQNDFGKYMEELLQSIISDIAFFQKNILICSRPNSGKTVWSYHLYSVLSANGYDIPPVKDLVEVKEILTSYTDKELARLFISARCAIIRIPRDVQFYHFATMASIIEKRVRSGGFTIFTYAGRFYDLKLADRDKQLNSLIGNGSYQTIEVKDFSKYDMEDNYASDNLC